MSANCRARVLATARLLVARRSGHAFEMEDMFDAATQLAGEAFTRSTEALRVRGSNETSSWDKGDDADCLTACHAATPACWATIWLIEGRGGTSCFRVCLPFLLYFQRPIYWDCGGMTSPRGPLMIGMMSTRRGGSRAIWCLSKYGKSNQANPQPQDQIVKLRRKQFCSLYCWANQNGRLVNPSSDP